MKALLLLALVGTTVCAAEPEPTPEQVDAFLREPVFQNNRTLERQVQSGAESPRVERVEPVGKAKRGPDSQVTAAPEAPKPPPLETIETPVDVTQAPSRMPWIAVVGGILIAAFFLLFFKKRRSR